MTRTIRRRVLFTCLGLCAAAALVRSQTPTLPQDQGVAGAWQKLRALQTTASAMHTAAHPDDEHGGVLTLLSRGQGARVSMLTLNRGESGDNAIGPELFEGVGLIRTEEMLVSGRYYGLDRQYFTTVIDYGFSKRLEEALEKWGREHVLRDVVRIIRMDRPFVLISRFQGNQRDGHGNHQTAGLITQEAFRAAGDPAMFPEQIAAGLRPWQPLKVYIGGVRENEDWTIRVDAGQYDPVLGESYQTFARIGLSFQRSQTSGRLNAQPGPAVSYYKRVDSVVDAPEKESSFFDGIDTSIPGIYRALRKDPPAGADLLLGALDREITAAVQAFTVTNPTAAAAPLARALAAARAASEKLGTDPDVKHILDVKERQIEDTVSTVLGVHLLARAQPAGSVEPTGPMAGFAAPAFMGPAVPGQTFEVRTVFTNRSEVPVTASSLELKAPRGWTVSGGPQPGQARPNTPMSGVFTVRLPEDAELSRPYFTRASIQESRYTVTDERHLYQPAAEPPLHAVVRYDVEGVPVRVTVPVTRLEPNLPYGYETRVLAVVPQIAVMMEPRQAVVPLSMADKKIRVRTELLNNVDGKTNGTLTLQVPSGWKVEPARQEFNFSQAGERAAFPFTVTIPSLEDREYEIQAVATAGGREFREGYDIIAHRDLETRYLFRDASAGVRGVDVQIARGLRVGYVMGVGDEVPSGIAQLGVDVQLLGAQELASADLSQFDAIMTGTRAYAVRDDLRTYNRRLLDYVRNGGNLIVLYNTQEFVPNQFAPYPGELPRGAEEVSEEDSPVEILAASHPVLAGPNRITKADFDGWVEQRGSKFWTTWSSEYTPILATWDQGQKPQHGGWLHARYGKGHYTYFAYAFHRQLPYGVPGAYRLLANLLSLGKSGT